MSKHEKTAHELEYEAILHKVNKKMRWHNLSSLHFFNLRESIQYALEKAEVYKTCTDGSYEAALDNHDFFCDLQDLKEYLHGS